MSKKILLILLVLLASCSFHGYIPSEFKDEKLHFLSSEDPEARDNLYLASQIEQSTELYNFFKLNGAPQAFRIRTPLMGDVELELYYPERQVAYSSSGKKKQAFFVWKAPQPDERLWNLEAVNLIDHKSVVPVFIIWDTEMRFAYYPEIRQAALRQLQSVKTDELYREAVIKKYTNSEAERFSSDLAERNASGDIVHRVKVAEESLSDISNWYTGTAGNVSKIASYNKISTASTIVRGQEIIIPASLVVNEKIKLPIQN